jgi:hypothetical protein
LIDRLNVSLADNFPCTSFLSTLPIRLRHIVQRMQGPLILNPFSDAQAPLGFALQIDWVVTDHQVLLP